MSILEPKQFWANVTAPLTAPQRKAVAHADGPLLVVAGPGSGKTTVITYRTAYLTQVAGVSPAALLVVTFTKAAADAMKARTAQVAGSAVASRATFGTFHSLAYRILCTADPSRRPQILDEDKQITLVRQLMRHVGLNTDDDTVMDAVAEISRMRAASTPVSQFKPRGINKAEFRQLYEGYQGAKAQRGVIDFDDLLHDALGLLHSKPDMLASYRQRYTHLMVDEFQDTNPVQWELVRLLADPRQNLCVVGDDDQSIYGWRGATPAFLLEFEREFPKAVRVTLDVNHRCPPPVVKAANRLVEHNQHRFADKHIHAVAAAAKAPPVERLVPADSLQEAEAFVQLLRASGEPLDDWAVIYRTNQQAHAIAQVLAQENVPYRALGGLPNLYRRWPVQDVLNYLKAAVGHDSALEPVINRPTRYISRQVMDAAKPIMAKTKCDLPAAIAQTGLLRTWQLRPLEELSDHLNRLGTMQAPAAIGYVRRFIGYDDYIREYSAREGGSADEMLGLLTEVERTVPSLPLMAFLAEVDSFSSRGSSTAKDGEPAVTLVTCHKAKGLEFPNVVVAGVVAGLLPHRSSDDVEEERRLLYVAMTRAQRRLWVSTPKTYEGREVQPSPFLAEALGDAPPGAPAAAGAAAKSRRKAAVPATPLPPGAAPGVSAMLPASLTPGTRVHHERHGEGVVESVDPTIGRVIIDFRGMRLSLDMGWCLGSPHFFRVLA